MISVRPPSALEHKLVARCLLENGVLIGSHAEIWTSGIAWRALGTFRECIDAITLLIGGGHAVQASFVKACVMQADGLSEVPFCLDEIAEFMVNDPEARLYWHVRVRDDMYPHACPRCGSAAYVGFLQIECRARCAGR